MLLVGSIIYLVNFQMSADKMFYQPNRIEFRTIQGNTVSLNNLIMGIEYNGQTKAYPIQFLGYHHQVKDSIGGKPVIITYCTVCRTGRVFMPIINGKIEEFRLVGMDHFNAMFEDKTTGSWWRQATGEAITGQLKGSQLSEIDFMQTTLYQWVRLHPNTLIMQPDKKFVEEYAQMKNYERGKSKGNLTRKDSLSWQNKSWIVGVIHNGETKAFDWNRLQKEKIIYDIVGKKPIAIILSNDSFSFVGFERENNKQKFVIKNDTMILENYRYNLAGKSLDGTNDLIPVKTYQEYWHSWKTFHPNTKH